MQEEVIARGAEAAITKEGNKITKDRIPKSYRHPILDEKLRKLRTRSEAKLLEKAYSIIKVPKVLKTDEQNKTIELEFIKGKKLADNLEKLDYISISKQIGASLAKLHDAGIIHGDLTTSNMIYSEDDNEKRVKQMKKHPKNYQDNSSSPIHERAGGVHDSIGSIFFIDFGLGFHSQKIEDKAVDLHLIKEALEAKHPSIYEKAFKSVLQGYKSSPSYNKVTKQLEAVEKRGRYKAQY